MQGIGSAIKWAWISTHAPRTGSDTGKADSDMQ